MVVCIDLYVLVNGILKERSFVDLFYKLRFYCYLYLLEIVLSTIVEVSRLCLLGGLPVGIQWFG